MRSQESEDDKRSWRLVIFTGVAEETNAAGCLAGLPGLSNISFV
jgi:hypothetical protein